MAIINGTQIGTVDISGRDVGVLLREKPFPYLYSDGVTRMSYDLWQLCHSPLINKWAKYSPLTANGGKWIAPAGEDNYPHSAIQEFVYYLPNDNYDADLSQFARYDTVPAAFAKMSFPDNLWSDADNYIPNLYLRWVSDTEMCLEDVYKEHMVNGKIELYPCVAIGNDWCTASNYQIYTRFQPAPPQVLNTPKQMTFCLTDTPKDYWGDPAPARAKFYSLKCDSETISTKTIQTQSQAIQYNVNILSAAYGSGAFATIKRRSDDVRGIYIEISRSDSGVVQSTGWRIYIYETERNKPTGAFLDAPLDLKGSMYQSMEDTFESQVSGIKDLKYDLYLNDKVVKSGSFPQVK